MPWIPIKKGDRLSDLPTEALCLRDHTLLIVIQQNTGLSGYTLLIVRKYFKSDLIQLFKIPWSRVNLLDPAC
jgi:hypothetical protein